MIEMHRRLAVMGRVLLWVAQVPAGVGRRDRRAVAGEDPREHGDRPQRDARPVGLDERSRDPLLDVGLGHRLVAPRRGSTPTTTSTTPTRTSSARTATSATRSCGSTRTSSGTRSTSRSRSTTSCWRRCSSGAWRSTTSTSRRSARARSPRQQLKHELKGIVRQGAPPDRQGLRRLPGARRAASWKRTLIGQLHGEHRPQRVVLRDHLLRPLPRTRPTRSREERGRGRDARRLVRAPAARRGEHRGRPALPRDQRQPRLPGRASPVPGHARARRYAEIAPKVKDICERYELPYNSGPFGQQLADGAADDPAAGVPGRQAAAEAGAVPRPVGLAGGHRLGPHAERAVGEVLGADPERPVEAGAVVL